MSGALSETEQRMGKVASDLRRELGGLRAGRASPAMVERVTVDYYGTPTPVRDLATLSVPEPRLLVIQPWDKGIVPAIEKAILKSDLGITPSSDGQVVRLAVPQLSEERRRELVKQVHRVVEEHKVALRTLRHDALDDLKARQKGGDLSEDEARREQDGIQKLMTRFEAEMESAAKEKEREVLTV